MDVDRRLTALAALAALACGGDAAGPPEGDPVPVGRLRIELTGAVEHQAEWAGFGEFQDLLVADTGETSYLGGQALGIDGGDSSLTVIFPGRLGTGQWEIGRYVLGSGTVDLPVAFLMLDGPATDDAMFLASLPGGTLEVTDSDYPQLAGLEPGVLRGALSFRAVRLIPGPGGQPIETTDTVDVDARFTAHWYHYLRPNVSLALDGKGPLVGTARRTFAQAADDGHGGLLVWWDADFNDVPEARPYEAQHEIRITTRSHGEFAISRFTPTQWANPDLWPPTYSSLYFRDDARLALSVDGTITVTRYVAPTEAYYGEIHGTVTTQLALWSDKTTESSERVRAVATFAVQLWPLAGVPAAPPNMRRTWLVQDLP